MCKWTTLPNTAVGAPYNLGDTGTHGAQLAAAPHQEPHCNGTNSDHGLHCRSLGRRSPLLLSDAFAVRVASVMQQLL
jgi:hypothetical protein